MSAPLRLNKVLKELNISMNRAVEFLESKGIEIEARPTTKIDTDVYDTLVDEFQTDMTKKLKSEEVSQKKREEKEAMRAEFEAKHEKPASVAPPKKEEVVKAKAILQGVKTLGKIDLNAGSKQAEAAESKAEEQAIEEVTPIVEEQTPVATVEEQTPVATVEEVEPVSEVKSENVEIESVKEQVEEVKTETVKIVEPISQVPTEPNQEKVGEKMEAPAEIVEVKSEEVKKEDVPQGAVETHQKEVEAEELVKIEVASTKESTPEAIQDLNLEEPRNSEKTKVDEVKAETLDAPKDGEEPAGEEGESGDKNILQTKYAKLSGPTFTGAKIDLSKFERPKKKVASSTGEPKDKKTGAPGDNKPKRKRISTGPVQGGNNRPNPGQGGRKKPANTPKVELTDEQIQKQVKETLEKLKGGGRKSKGSKLRKLKREERKEQVAQDEMQREEAGKTLQVTEFVTVNELATMMDVPPIQVISACMSLGIMVTMNQRLDAETLTIVAEEFGYDTHFVDADVQEAFEAIIDNDEDLEPRAPIVTVMGHVDHGKTSLLDYIRKANVIAGESGGITQHIGAYSVELPNGNNITFLDTPGHEAFTAMRARGAQVTDVVIIVVAADDDVMPQTKEAISHAQAAGVPFVVAINKIDRPSANAEKIREKLSIMNVLVEDWGGKVQCQEISAKMGLNIDALLEKVLLEAEVLDLKANPNRNSAGTIIEAALDKGRGYISTILVQNGTLKIGDYVLAGQYSGKVRALLDERGQRVDNAGPSVPVSLLGLDGAPQAGDKFIVMDDEKEAKSIAARRQQLQREQSVRTTKNLTLEEIGRRLALGDFQELNIILKGDVDGSIEALSDALEKLSTEQVQVRIIHKAVGQISESDVLLSAASNAIIVGFQVRPSSNARKLAEKEQVDIRLYSIIYDAIDQVKDAMEGMLAPEIKEEITCSIEVRDTFKISKVGTIAGCMVLDGTIKRNSRIRLIRDGVVVYTGELGSLKRFKDDAKEVAKGFECGLNIQNFNDIKSGDIIEGFKEVEFKKTL